LEKLALSGTAAVIAVINFFCTCSVAAPLGKSAWLERGASHGALAGASGMLLGSAAVTSGSRATG
jgi:hypothetical protein